MILDPHVQAELLSPAQLSARLTATPVVYLPLGVCEFHGPHLPVGLDALNAHGVCARAAARGGGVVLPPQYWGVGGSHGGYPWSLLVQDAGAVTTLVEQTLGRLEQLGARLAVLFSGHYAPEQVALVEALQVTWNARAGSLRVLAASVEMTLPGLPAPDHAGLFETSLLWSFWPELVHLELLPEPGEPSGEPEDPYGPQRHQADHPLHGVFGADPRAFDPARGAEVAEGVVTELLRRVGAAGQACAPALTL